MSRLAALKAATTLGDVAELLRFKPKAVSYILYKQPAAAKYKTFQIPKQNGGQRTISAPVDALKLLQRRLSDLLQDCVDEVNTAKQRKDRIAHGFKRGRSIITNARRHRHRRWVFNLDLEDFFPSINFGRVRGFLLKNRDFELHQNVATVIAQIACHDNSLPQGSPCSPVISNLVAHVLDMRLIKLASSAGCTYSRYVDDLTFSTNKKDFPASIAAPTCPSGHASHLWLPGEAIRNTIHRTGFRINAKKTRLMYRSSRQDVTGLVVNKRISARWEYRHNVRAMVHSLVKTGVFEAMSATQNDAQAATEKRVGTINELHGMLGFIDSIDRDNKSTTSDEQLVRMSSRERLYRQFLIYSTFYAALAPVIICEGETDNIYLTHAIMRLAPDFPMLAELRPDGSIRLRVRLYKYPRTSTARLLGLRDGGSGVLGAFIAAYAKETKVFTGPGLTSPIVILYDNDSGAKPICNAIKNVSGTKPTPTVPFVHVVKNLYAVPTPLRPATESSRIEDFFDATIKATVIDGKTFNDGDGFDADKHYGKKVFAHKVVRQKAGKIDFAAFHPLLTNLTAVINRHKASVVPQSSGP
jgi:RNA-directed DNA polymerase